jgi:hypothetical protein
MSAEGIKHQQLIYDTYPRRFFYAKIPAGRRAIILGTIFPGKSEKST